MFLWNSADAMPPSCSILAEESARYLGNLYKWSPQKRTFPSFNFIILLYLGSH